MVQNKVLNFATLFNPKSRILTTKFKNRHPSQMLDNFPYKMNNMPFGVDNKPW